MIEYWRLPTRTPAERLARRIAREGFEKLHPIDPRLPDVPPGHRPVEFVLDGQTGMVGSAGFFWAYNSALEKLVARLGAASNESPDSRITIEEDGVTYFFVGSSGGRSLAFLDSCFAPSYRAAVSVEEELAKRADQLPTTKAVADKFLVVKKEEESCQL